MGASPRNNKPTIGTGTWLPRTPKPTEQDRSFAQPLPGKKTKKVEERAEASEKDKAKALSDHSQMGVDYTAQPEQENQSDEAEAEAEVEWLGDPEEEEPTNASVEAEVVAEVEEPSDEDLDALDPDEEL
jgi:hypothetical protein